MPRDLSEIAYKEAVKYIPGGVNSPVRALQSVGVSPLFVEKAKGAFITDIDSNKYLDFCGSWGVFLVGHNHPYVKHTVKLAIDKGTSFGIPTLQETVLAKTIVNLVPSLEKVRFVSSGTEAVMSAIRLARAYTKRNLIIKFDGCYHGHADHLLVAAGSGLANLAQASSLGIPDSFTEHTLSLPYNDVLAINKIFTERGNEIAAVIIEPIAANMGLVLPQAEFINALRKFTSKHGAVLIFDEVITGFRLGLGGAQELMGIEPDLSTFGKIIGGGFPAAAFGGKAEIMDLLAPLGPVYQAGTLSGNPVAMTAGQTTLEILQEPKFYATLNEKAERFYEALEDIIEDKPIQLKRIGSMFSLFFSTRDINNFNDVKNSDLDAFKKFYQGLLQHQIYFSPSPFETNFISAAHTEKDLSKTLRIIKKILN